jgi:hypothetical protein
MRVLLVVCFALALAPAAAAAPVGPIFGLRAVGNPKLGYFVYPASAGTTLHGAVTVTNTGDETGTVKLYPADATTGQTTGTVYLTDKAPAGVGTWIGLGASSLSLAPGQNKQVPFTVRVPGGVAAGQYVGGIVAETVREATGPKSSQTTNVQIKVRNLSIVAVEVEVPGAQVAKFTIGKVSVGGSQGRQQVFIAVSNDGNVLRKPAGAVTIQNSSGVKVQRIPFQMDTFLPHTSIDYPVQLAKALPPGNYVASVQMSYQGTGSAGTEVSSAAPAFSVSKQNVSKVFKPTKPTQVGPGGVVAASKSSSKLWEYVAAGVGALLLAGGGYFIALYRSRRPVTVTATPVPPPPPPAAEPPAPLPPAAPVVPPPPAPAEAPPPPAASAADADRCHGFHYWQVDWDRGEAGPDGRMTYPHRCRNCGIAVRATDIGDATDKAAAGKG